MPLLMWLVADSAYAYSPGVKIAPLKYQESIPLGSKKVGFVDVSNPSNEMLVLIPEVQAFRQLGVDGELQFYDDEQIKSGITFDVGTFELAPKEAARIKFTIDPNKLKRGGVYGALFFRTDSRQAEASPGSQIASSARVGTLLILDIGVGGTKDGRIDNIKIPKFSFGDGIKGSFTYTNSSIGPQPIASNPEFKLKVGFLTRQSNFSGPLVLPDSSRTVNIDKKGNFIGLVPVMIEDKVGKSPPATFYVLAITGFWKLFLPLFFVAVVVSAYITIREKS